MCEVLEASGSLPGTVMPLRGHLAMSEEIFGCHNGVCGATGIQWVEVRDTAKYSTMYRSPPQQIIINSNISKDEKTYSKCFT